MLKYSYEFYFNYIKYIFFSELKKRNEKMGKTKIHIDFNAIKTYLIGIN